MGAFKFLKKKKEGLLGPVATPPRVMGTQEAPIHENVEAGFDKKIPIIFPTKSPVNSLAGPPQETRTPPDVDFKPAYSGRFMKRLLEDRADLNKVYSEGYFENHYPEADKELKQFLHEKTMASWAKSRELVEDIKEDTEEKSSGITVVINIK